MGRRMGHLGALGRARQKVRALVEGFQQGLSHEGTLRVESGREPPERAPREREQSVAALSDPRPWGLLLPWPKAGHVSGGRKQHTFGKTVDPSSREPES